MHILFGILLFVPFVSARLSKKASNGQSSLCGVKGYNGKTEAYFYTTKSSLTSFEACRAHCLADSQCNSFVVGQGACGHYNVAV
jgi:hypothetical protein